MLNVKRKILSGHYTKQSESELIRLHKFLTNEIGEIDFILSLHTFCKNQLCLVNCITHNRPFDVWKIVTKILDMLVFLVHF